MPTLSPWLVQCLTMLDHEPPSLSSSWPTNWSVSVRDTLITTRPGDMVPMSAKSLQNQGWLTICLLYTFIFPFSNHNVTQFIQIPVISIHHSHLHPPIPTTPVFFFKSVYTNPTNSSIKPKLMNISWINKFSAMVSQISKLFITFFISPGSIVK